MNRVLTPSMKLKSAKITVLLLFLVFGLILSACGNGNNNEAANNNANNTKNTSNETKQAANTASEPAAPDIATFTVTSSAYENGGRIQDKYTRTGGDDSIPFEWTGAPAETKSYALLLYDLHPVANGWVHWMVGNIPASVTSLAEGVSGTDQLPAGIKELQSSYGEKRYGGPNPPAGSGDHEYKTIIYALDVETIEWPEPTSFRMFEKLVSEHTIGKAEISGFYEKE